MFLFGYVLGAIVASALLIAYYESEIKVWKDITQRSLNAYRVYQDE